MSQPAKKPLPPPPPPALKVAAQPSTQSTVQPSGQTNGSKPSKLPPPPAASRLPPPPGVKLPSNAQTSARSQLPSLQPLQPSAPNSLPPNSQQSTLTADLSTLKLKDDTQRQTQLQQKQQLQREEQQRKQTEQAEAARLAELEGSVSEELEQQEDAAEIAAVDLRSLIDISNVRLPKLSLQSHSQQEADAQSAIGYVLQHPLQATAQPTHVFVPTSTQLSSAYSHLLSAYQSVFLSRKNDETLSAAFTFNTLSPDDQARQRLQTAGIQAKHHTSATAIDTQESRDAVQQRIDAAKQRVLAPIDHVDDSFHQRVRDQARRAMGGAIAGSANDIPALKQILDTNAYQQWYQCVQQSLQSAVAATPPVEHLTLLVIGRPQCGITTLIGQLLISAGGMNPELRNNYESTVYPPYKLSLANTNKVVTITTLPDSVYASKTSYTERYAILLKHLLQSTHLMYVCDSAEDDSTASLSNYIVMQTLYLARLSQHQQLLLVVSKCDVSDYTQQRYTSITSYITANHLKQAGFNTKQITSVPVSALHNENVASINAGNTKLSSWYSNRPTLLQALEKLTLPEHKQRDIVMRQAAVAVVIPSLSSTIKARHQNGYQQYDDEMILDQTANDPDQPLTIKQVSGVLVDGLPLLHVSMQSLHNLSNNVDGAAARKELFESPSVVVVKDIEQLQLTAALSMQSVHQPRANFSKRQHQVLPSNAKRSKLAHTGSNCDSVSKPDKTDTRYAAADDFADTHVCTWKAISGSIAMLQHDGDNAISTAAFKQTLQSTLTWQQRSRIKAGDLLVSVQHPPSLHTGMRAQLLTLPQLDVTLNIGDSLKLYPLYTMPAPFTKYSTHTSASDTATTPWLTALGISPSTRPFIASVESVVNLLNKATHNVISKKLQYVKTDSSEASNGWSAESSMLVTLELSHAPQLTATYQIAPHFSRFVVSRGEHLVGLLTVVDTQDAA